jgi:hypothetical protein
LWVFQSDPYFAGVQEQGVPGDNGALYWAITIGGSPTINTYEFHSEGTATTTPEPTTALFLGGGAILLGAYGLKRSGRYFGAGSR